MATLSFVIVVVLCAFCATTAVATGTAVRTNFTTAGRLLKIAIDDGSSFDPTASNSKVFEMRGFSYSNYRIGEGPSAITDGPFGFDSLSRVDICKQDFPKMRQYNVNTIKLYDFNVIANGIDKEHKKCFDELWNNGSKPIFVVLSVWIATLPFPSETVRTNTTNAYKMMVDQTADHPAVMGYSIGSEFGGDPNNNPPLWKDFNLVATTIRKALNGRKKIITTGVYQAPCTSCNPVVPDIGHVINGEQNNAGVDMWGVDIYSPNPQNPILHENIFKATSKPFWFPEFGVWYQPPLNVQSQSELLVEQISGLMQFSYNESTANENQGQNMTTYKSSGPIFVGGLIFEWIDEYWKGGPLCTPNPASAQPWYGANQVQLRQGCECVVGNGGNFSGVCATDERVPRPILSNSSMLPSLWSTYVPRF